MSEARGGKHAWTSDSELIEALRDADRRVGGELSSTKYRELDDVPPKYLLRRRFGTWNGAKAAAGLPVTPSQAAGSGESLEDYYQRVRAAAACAECGEDSTACLQFHHLDPEAKSFNIGSFADAGVVSFIELRDEMRKCAILCANCHRKDHSSLHPFTAGREHRFSPPEPLG